MNKTNKKIENKKQLSNCNTKKKTNIKRKSKKKLNLP